MGHRLILAAWCVVLAAVLGACNQETIVWTGDGDGETADDATEQADITESSELADNADAPDGADSTEINGEMDNPAEDDQTTEDDLTGEQDLAEQDLAEQDTPGEQDLTEQDTPGEQDLAEQDIPGEQDLAEQDTPGEQDLAEQDAPTATLVSGTLFLGEAWPLNNQFSMAGVALYAHYPLDDDAGDPVGWQSLFAADFSASPVDGAVQASWRMEGIPAGQYWLAAMVFTTDNLSGIPTVFSWLPDQVTVNPAQGPVNGLVIYLDVQDPARGLVKGRVAVMDLYTDPDQYRVSLAALDEDQFANLQNGDIYPVSVTSIATWDSDDSAGYRLLNIPDGPYYVIAVVQLTDQETPVEFDYQGPFLFSPQARQYDEVDFYFGVPDPNQGVLSGRITLLNPPASGDMLVVVAGDQFPPTNPQKMVPYLLTDGQQLVDYELAALNPGSYYLGAALMHSSDLQTPYAYGLHSLLPVTVSQQAGLIHEDLDFTMGDGIIQGRLTVNYQGNRPDRAFLSVTAVMNMGGQNVPLFGATLPLNLVQGSGGGQGFVADYRYEGGMPGLTHLFRVALDINGDNVADMEGVVTPGSMVFPTNGTAQVTQDLTASGFAP